MKAEYRWVKGDGIYSKDKEKSVLMKFKGTGRSVWQRDGAIPTREFHSLAVDDKVGQLLGDLSTLLLILGKVELLTELHVEHLQVQTHTGHGEHC